MTLEEFNAYLNERFPDQEPSDSFLNPHGWEHVSFGAIADNEADCVQALKDRVSKYFDDKIGKLYIRRPANVRFESASTYDYTEEKPWQMPAMWRASIRLSISGVTAIEYTDELQKAQAYSNHLGKNGGPIETTVWGPA